MYQDQFPHHEIPKGVIQLSRNKFSRLKNLLVKYEEIGFTDYSLVDLSLLSTKQWKNRDFPIPEGYKRSHNKILAKITPIELIENDLKSNTIVK